MRTNRSMIITGVSGFLGYTLVTELRHDFRVIAGLHRNLPEFRIDESVPIDLETDLVELDRLCSSLSSHGESPVIVHSAALSTVKDCEEHPERARAINAEGTSRIARIAATYGCPLFMISTDLVYSGEPSPFAEDRAIPSSCYTRTKLEGEHAVRTIHPPGIILRCALMVGPDTERAPSHIRKMDRMIQRGEPLRLFIDEFRTPIWTPDIARIIRRALETGVTGQTFNVGGPDRISRYELGLMAGRILEWPSELILPVSFDSVAQPGVRSKDCSLDTTRIRRTLGIDFTSIASGLPALAQHWRRNG